MTTVENNSMFSSVIKQPLQDRTWNADVLDIKGPNGIGRENVAKSWFSQRIKQQTKTHKVL